MKKKEVYTPKPMTDGKRNLIEDYSESMTLNQLKRLKKH